MQAALLGYYLGTGADVGRVFAMIVSSFELYCDNYAFPL
jgi:hypothetical protein